MDLFLSSANLASSTPSGLGTESDDLTPASAAIMSSLGGLGVQGWEYEVGEGPDGVSLVLLRDAGLVAGER